MVMNELLEPFAGMLDSAVSPDAIRSLENDGNAQEMWDAVAASGFLDALVSEEAGGAGLSLEEVGPLWLELGRHAVPLPVAETMVARHLLAQSGQAVPDGPIALATGDPRKGVLVPYGMVSEHVLFDWGDKLVLAPVAEENKSPTGVRGDQTASLRWPDLQEMPSLPRPSDGLRPIAALIRAGLIAGAADRVLDMTVAYANERVQFGKPIGRQQALQHNLAVMAEDAVSCRIAVEMACSAGLPVGLTAAAVAKSVAGGAAARTAASAHAIFGAIGISIEHDLQLYTRNLQGWRLADGSESYWNEILGSLRSESDLPSVEWVRNAWF